MERNILIAPMGEDIETLFPVIRTFPTESIVLISDKESLKSANEFQKTLKKFRIPVRIVVVKSYSIEEIFKAVKSVADSKGSGEILVNVTSSDKVTSCLTLCAAYVHGMRAVGVVGDNVMLLPIMKFSYYKLLSDQKLRILKFLYQSKDCCASLEELSKNVKMSFPLISYHINGRGKVDGLLQMGLVETAESRKKIEVKLSELGKMLMAGYL